MTSCKKITPKSSFQLDLGVIRLRQDTQQLAAEMNGEATAPYLVKTKAGKATTQFRSR